MSPTKKCLSCKQVCSVLCEDGYHGDSCNETCASGCKICHISNGVCILEPQALAIDALSQDWPNWLKKVIQKLRATQDGEIILIAPCWPSHLLHLCVWTTLGLSHTAETYCHNRGMSRPESRTICVHRGSHSALSSSRLLRRGL